MNRSLVLLSLLLFPVLAFAAPLEREVGAGLIYIRVHKLPEDLPPRPVGRVPPCIVDLRYVDAQPRLAIEMPEAPARTRMCLRPTDLCLPATSCTVVC